MFACTCIFNFSYFYYCLRKSSLAVKTDKKKITYYIEILQIIHISRIIF